MSRKPNRHANESFVPGLEVLEDRLLLDAYVWNPDPKNGNLNWSSRSNWENAAGVQYKAGVTAFAAGDTITFTGTTKNQNRNSTDDMKGVAVDELVIGNGYTGTINLQNSLSVDSGSMRSNAFLGGVGNLTIGPAMPPPGGSGAQNIFTWAEGTMGSAAKTQQFPAKRVYELPAGGDVTGGGVSNCGQRVDVCHT